MKDTTYSVERVTLRRVAIPMHEPFRIANGEVTLRESIVIEAESEGKIGYGEAAPMPAGFYSVETPDSTWQALAESLVPDLLISTIQSPVDYAESLNTFGKEPFARAGIEGAIWDLTARKFNTTIGAMIGAKHPHAIASGLAIGLYDTIPELLERIEHYLARGYQRLKIKIQPGWDLEPLRAIRDAYDNIPLMVDANASYDLRLHRRSLLALDEFNLVMIEQPLAANALDDLAELGQVLRTPICVDESADSLDGLEEIVLKRAAHIVNIKVQRVGGLWNAKRMHDRARRANLDCWLGTMPELGIASAQALEIATLPSFVYPTDIEESARWYHDDIVTPLISLRADGTLDVPHNGFSVDREKLEKYTTHQQEFRS